MSFPSEVYPAFVLPELVLDAFGAESWHCRLRGGNPGSCYYLLFIIITISIIMIIIIVFIIITII